MPTLDDRRHLCCVFGCDTLSSKKNFDRFYRLPKADVKGGEPEGLLQRWVTAIKLHGLISKMKICYKHFVDDDFEDGASRKILKKDAVPSQRLPLVWRNKFVPRKLGKLVKLTEYRGIGRLRLCHEAKIVAFRRKGRRRNNNQSNNSDIIITNVLPKPINNMTSELIIKEEPIDVPPANSDMEIEEDSIEQMLFRMNEDTKKDNGHTKEIGQKINHTKEEEKQICMLCEESFKSKEELIRHVESHTRTNNHVCKVCKQDFASLEELDNHVRSHKIVKRVYNCRECGLGLKTKAECWEHLSEHLRSRRKPYFPCNICGRVLATKMILKEHLFTHTGEKPFECQLCGKKVRHRSNFVNHVKSHDMEETYKCTVCNAQFLKKSHLNSHFSSEHPNDLPFTCSICGLKFKTETRFVKHAVTHDAHLEEE